MHATHARTQPDVDAGAAVKHVRQRQHEGPTHTLSARDDIHPGAKQTPTRFAAMGGLTCCWPCFRSRPTLHSRRPTPHCRPCCLTCVLPHHLRTSRTRWPCFCSPPTQHRTWPSRHCFRSHHRPLHNCTQCQPDTTRNGAAREGLGRCKSERDSPAQATHSPKDSLTRHLLCSQFLG
jgi:hypothetical protein